MVTVKVSSTKAGSLRIVIPKAIADAFGIKEGSRLEIIIKNNYICYKKVKK